jgi:hypothetical protein
MQKFVLIISLLCGLSAQDFEVSGRATIVNDFTDYNENSRFGTDSIPFYSKTNLFNGNNQVLNLSLFGRKRDLEFQFQSDISRYNNWKDLNFNDLERLTLLVSNDNFRLNIGDFYEFRSEEFMANREVRGAKFSYNFADETKSLLQLTALYGQIERKHRINEKIYSQYQTVETIGTYQRKAFAFYADLFAVENLLVNLDFLTGSDEKDFSIGASEDPLKNMTFGGEVRYRFLDNAMSAFGRFMQSSTDTLYENKENSESLKDTYIKGGMNYFHRHFNLDISYFQIKPKYYSFGNPFLETDKQGFDSKSSVRFSNEYYLDLNFMSYKNNLEKDSTFTTKTKFISSEFGTMFSSKFNAAVSVVLQFDESDKLDDEFIEKQSTTIELRTSYDLAIGRLSLSYSNTDFTDKSVFTSGNALSSKQDLLNFSYFLSPNDRFESSGGLVFSNYSSSDKSSTKSYFIYTANKYNVIPQKLRAELGINLNLSSGNESENDTFTQEEKTSALLSSFLNQFDQLDGYVAFEYFFSYNVSAKLTYGVNNKEFDYIKNFSNAEIVSLINSIDSQNFFDKNESFYAKKIVLELNFLF